MCLQYKKGLGKSFFKAKAKGNHWIISLRDFDGKLRRGKCVVVQVVPRALQTGDDSQLTENIVSILYMCKFLILRMYVAYKITSRVVHKCWTNICM